VSSGAQSKKGVLAKETKRTAIRTLPSVQVSEEPHDRVRPTDKSRFVFTLRGPHHENVTPVLVGGGRDWPAFVGC
jgi:hypothetical protein